jgi:hypothetical protein
MAGRRETLKEILIVGGLQFIGYHISNYFVENGKPVIGIEWEKNNNLIEEKQLEIGRNSNFKLVDLENITSVELMEDTTIIVSWYDIDKGSTENKEQVIREIDAYLGSLKHPSRKLEPKVIFLECMTEEGIDPGRPRTEYQPDSSIFLPTIYGPWQHKSMVFEQAIRKQERTQIKASVSSEYKGDAIYITDLLEKFELIIQIPKKRIAVKNSLPNQWTLCYKQLFSDEELDDSSTDLSPLLDAYLYTISGRISPEKGIQLQREHSKRLELLNKWKDR